VLNKFKRFVLKNVQLSKDAFLELRFCSHTTDSRSKNV